MEQQSLYLKHISQSLQEEIQDANILACLGLLYCLCKEIGNDFINSSLSWVTVWTVTSLASLKLSQFSLTSTVGIRSSGKVVVKCHSVFWQTHPQSDLCSL